MNRWLCRMLLLLYIAVLSACGDTPQPAPAAHTMKASIKAAALTANQNIAGIELTMTVPPGITPTFNADGTVNAAATVTITSSAGANQTLPGATYIPATASASGQLSISAIVASGFSANDEISIHLNVANGVIPLAGDFTLLAFKAYSGVDASGNGGKKLYDMSVTDGSNTITLTPTLTATIQ